MTADGSPTSRALLTLEYLQSAGRLHAGELAERLGVSERAARRYVGMLREAGIPVESTRGPYGGYRLGRGLRLPPLVFTAAEALGLVMAVLDGHHAAADVGDPVGGALGKLVRALPENVAAQAAAVRQHASAAPDLGAVRPDAATTTNLVTASAGRHRVRIEYRAESGREWTTVVDPWAVVVRHGRWYLLCRTEAGDVRSYRVDRVQRVEELAETFDPPGDLDPVALVEENLASGWEFEAVVLLQAPLDHLTWLPRRGLGILERVDEETTRLRGTTGNPYWYAGQLATSLAETRVSFTVEGGDELRSVVHALGTRLIGAAQP